MRPCQVGLECPESTALLRHLPLAAVMAAFERAMLGCYAQPETPDPRGRPRRINVTPKPADSILSLFQVQVL
eukprot:3176311-Rhodomonas_salina.1